MAVNQRIIPVSIESEMKSAYIDYSMSVIVSRALPDVRDGLKPVHRRVLYGMSQLGLSYNKAHKKSARIVGEVLGKYHPHGDSSVYDSMVRMAQDWSLRYPLVDGQGNFGSMDGDSPAAMRYTEARLKRISDELLTDINKNTVDFSLNFDDTLTEPTVLPTKFPNLLVNGASGIAVGMATNMLPHNLSEVIDGVVATIENPDITFEEIIQHVKAPDFPTGGIIHGYAGVRDALETGRGRVIVRGKAEIEEMSSGRERIIITEIPYQVNKASLVAKIAELVNDKKIEGISDLREESDRNGLRIVVEVKRDAMGSVVLSKLYKYTPLQSSFGVNNVALVGGRPMILGLQDIIREFIKFRLEVVVRRTKFDLNKALERAHILIGILIALDHIDKIITLIRGSKTPDEARAGLMQGDFIDDKEKFWAQFRTLIDDNSVDENQTQTTVLSEAQAKAILDMRLQRLTGLERDKVQGEYDDLQERIAYFRSILADEGLQRSIITEELVEIKERYGDERRTKISYAEGDISMEDLIKDEEVVITISHLGYVKRTPMTEYREQARGGRGARGAVTRDADFVEHILVVTTHDYLLLFTEAGKCYWIRGFDIPEASKTSSGRVIQNLLNIPKQDKVKAYIVIKDLKDDEFVDSHNIIFCTRKGLVKKTAVRAYARPRSGGIAAININEGDQLLEARLTDGTMEVFMANKYGNAIRFQEKDVRPMGRTATGVRGIRLAEDGIDEVVGMVCVEAGTTEETIMVISEKGSGKRTEVEEYRRTKRGGKGVKTMQISDKTGKLIAIKTVKEDDGLMITSKNGIMIRMAVDGVRVMGRATQGVRVIRIDDDDDIADVAVIPADDEEIDENIEGAENTAIVEGGTDVEIVDKNDTTEEEE